MPCMVPPCGWRQHMAAFRSAASSDITAAVLSHAHHYVSRIISAPAARLEVAGAAIPQSVIAGASLWGAGVAGTHVCIATRSGNGS
jgi:hypothetical protein